MARKLRIGCAAGFWGDTQDAARQLVTRGDIDFLVFDYLSEITLSLLARARMRDPQAGYVPDFASALAPLLQEIAARRIRVIANAGGINPRACVAALTDLLDKEGVSLKVALVEGDDLGDRQPELQAADVREMFNGASLPPQLLSVNAYLGARPIAAALDAGADIVVTGRCVDSALALGPLMHAFGWAPDDWDRLAAGSLCGHLIECGAQVTGGLFTDWAAVPGWDDMGFPVAECAADGSFAITKPPGTGGLIAPLAVAEQLLYEIGDPAAYILPDVICDFTQVRIEADGPDRVGISGARGRPVPPSLKVSATYPDGYRAITSLTIGGVEAASKARRVGEAILARTRRLLAQRNLGDYRDTSIEVLGTEATYGPQARPEAGMAREVVLKIGVHHDDKAAVALFSREIAPAATAMAQGLTGFYAGRPTVQPVARLFSFLWPKERTPVTVTLGRESWTVAWPPADTGEAEAAASPAPVPAAPPTDEPLVEVPLLRLACGRSGDKGDNANVGVVARDPAFLPYIRAALTPAAVARWYGHLLQGEVERFDLPGIHALNFMLHRALGGGGVASLRIDPQGKAFAQMLMDFPVPVPTRLAARLNEAG